MNKKRVALALAAALGMNSLMVTVGAVGGQAFIAHAQDSKLSTDLLDKLKTLEIESLETSVDMSTDGKAQVTFTKISPETISNVTGEFEYKPFTERSDLKETASKATGVWDKNTGKFNVSGITQPGIYTGEVTIVYANKMTAKYTLSLVKKPSDSVSFTTDITTGQLVLKDLKFNNGSQEIANFEPKSVTAYLGNDKTKAVELTKDSTTGEYKVSLLKLGKNGNLDLNDTVKVEIAYGNNKEYTLTSDIVLVQDKSSTFKSVAATNDSTAMNTLKTTLKNDFNEAKEPELPSHVADTDNYIISVGTDKLLEYNQTVKNETTGNTAKIGGAKLKVDQPTAGTKEVKISVESAKVDSDISTLEDNFVPTSKVGFGFTAPAGGANATTSDVALIGEYSFNVSGVGSATYFNAFSSASVTSATSTITNSTYRYVDITNGVKDFTSGINTNASVTLNLENFKHGYQTVAVTFDYNDVKDKENINKQQPTNSGNEIPVGAEFTPGSFNSVQTSLIISTDKIDGVAVQSKFVKTSSSEGQVTIVGGSKLLNDLVGSLDYNKPVLTIDGVKATVNSNKSNDNDLVFDVQFSGAVPNKTDASWILDINGKKVEGKVDLTPGVVESVNLTNVQATNSGTENITDQFKIDAKFNSTVPTGTVKVDNLNSDRVTFDQFKSGNHTVSTEVVSGKYQGLYSAGVIANYNPITVLLKADNPTTSSVRLTIDMDFFGNNDLIKNITGGIIYYREYKAGLGANDGWQIAKSADISSSDIKEDPVTKVVTGLNAGKEYEFVVTYSYKEGNSEIQAIYSNIAVATTKPGSSSNNGGTISGGSSSSSSTGSTTVNVTSTNSTKGSTSISVTIPSGVSYTESNANPSPVGFKYKDKNGKTVTETNDQYSNVKARFQNGKVVLEGLVPGKEYTEISINYNDKNNKTKTLVLKNVKIDSTSEGQSYLANVYNVVFNRPADENGYMFHLGNLTSKKVSLRAFLLNMINEKEFDKLYTTAENKVEALYNAIVNRDSDTQGKAFWVAEYKKLLSVYGSSSATLQALADRMVNENELKTLAQKLNFEW